MKKNNNFKYVVLFVILFIPFIYSFFYLKAYWNPYGKGNIDNLPVAIVNFDEGDKGKDIIEGIKKSKKLKLKVTKENDAETGLNSGKYYAVIKIPEDFTSSLESVSTDNKKHPTITYSPNQKSNYLASQIINTVVLNVQKNLDNEVNSKIVKSLSDNLMEVPDSLNTITDGFNKLSNGTSMLKDGSLKILDGSNSLVSNYSKFNDGIKTLKSGSSALSNGTSKIEKELSNSINNLNEELTDSEKTEILSSVNSNPNLSDLSMEYAAVNGLEQNSSYIALKSKYTQGKNTYNSGVSLYNAYLMQANQLVPTLTDEIITSCANNTASSEVKTAYCLNDNLYDLIILKKDLIAAKKELDNMEQILSGIELVAKETAKKTKNAVSSAVAINVASSVKQKSVLTTKESLNNLLTYIKQMNNGALGVNNGVNTLSLNSDQILNGVNTLNNANSELNSGILTLNSSVNSAKKELQSKTDSAKDSIKKVESLEDYSKDPINVETKEVNKVSSYGTAFTPLFVSVGLWVGCLMMFMVLYYDKEERFGIFGINDNRYVKQTLAYHGLVSLSSIVLALLLDLFLDIKVTNYLLYYGSFIAIANLFMSIVKLLITNFKDVGKFIALILLVLQLASSGGTFPVETVTKSFRWMNSFLPMTYTIRLLKESLVKTESITLSKSLLVVITLFIVIFVLNIITDLLKQKKAK